MNFYRKKVLVFGTGISGISAVKLLQKTKAEIILYDSNNTLDKNKILKDLSNDFQGKIILGDLPDDIIEEIDLAVISPGIPRDIDIINNMEEKGIPIWGEIELAYTFDKGKIIGITGTNGKTTTTTLVGQIMQEYFDSVFVVGNIGIPYTKIALNTTKESVTVAEISSFQLETIKNFKPNVSAILNITPDHLNRHYTMENYINMKVNITMNQKDEDVCVLNYEDEVVRQIGKKVKCNVFYFSSNHKLENGIYLENDNIIYSNNNKKIIICNTHELNVIGKHSYENVMAAVGMAICVGVPLDYIRRAVKKFVAVEHRIEYVTTKNGVRYYNDSKGTNPDASMKAIEAMETPTLLIAGGYDKGSEYVDWVQTFGNKIRHLILLGETKEKIAKAAREQGFQNIIMVDTLLEAVNICALKAREGDSVLLSPACASWGMFKDYEERGMLFKKYVREL
jgi:UDP-N-acetylmuramoylalanine--D-glutamate ligase